MVTSWRHCWLSTQAFWWLVSTGNGRRSARSPIPTLSCMTINALRRLYRQHRNLCSWALAVEVAVVAALTSTNPMALSLAAVVAVVEWSAAPKRRQLAALLQQPGEQVLAVPVKPGHVWRHILSLYWPKPNTTNSGGGGGSHGNGLTIVAMPVLVVAVVADMALPT